MAEWSEGMRIGELLLQQRKLRQGDLARALEEQAAGRHRLCSLLIAGGAIEFDDGARALGEQKRVPCALTKHLEHRDPELASLLPAELGRASCALPIGRTSQGSLIVCVRDPAEALLAALEQATRAHVLMVITPALRLEELVAAAYGPVPHDEFDVDFTSNVNLPPLPDLDALDPDSVRLALADLDDERVAKDPTQNSLIRDPRESMSSIRIGGRAQTQPIVGRTATPPRVPLTLDAVRFGLDRASTRDDATTLAMQFVCQRWVSGILFAIRDQHAAGYRGHGAQVRDLEAMALPLDGPSSVQRAIETRRTWVQPSAGPVQDQLVRALGTTAISAAPVLAGGDVVAVLAVGEPVHDAQASGAFDAVDSATSDLTRVADALGGAYTRIRRG